MNEIPKDWKLVPIEATYEMVVAAALPRKANHEPLLAQIYRAMLAAAPVAAPAPDLGNTDGRQPAQGGPDEPCDNCGLGHPSNNCIYKPAQGERLYRHTENGGIYEYLFTAEPAGAAKRDGLRLIEVYQGEDGRGWYRFPSDFAARMTKVENAAAPTPPETWKALPSQSAPDAAATCKSPLQVGQVPKWVCPDCGFEGKWLFEGDK